MKNLHSITCVALLAFTAASQAATTISDSSVVGTPTENITTNLTDQAALDWRDFQNNIVMTNGLGVIGPTNQIGTFDILTTVPQLWPMAYSDGDPTNSGAFGVMAGSEVGEGGVSNPVTQIDIGEGFSYDVSLTTGTWELQTYTYARRSRGQIIYDFTDISVTNSWQVKGVGSLGGGDKVAILKFSVDAPDTLTVRALCNETGGGGGGDDLFGIRAAALLPPPSFILLPPKDLGYWQGEDNVIPNAGNGNAHFDEVRGFPFANTNVTDAVATNVGGFVDGGFLYVAYPFQASGALMFKNGDTNNNYQGPTIYGGELAYGPFTDGFATNWMPGVETNLSVSQGPNVSGRDNLQGSSGNDRIFLRSGANNATAIGSGLACGILFDSSPATLAGVEEALLDIQNISGSNRSTRLLLTVGGTQYVSQDLGWTNAGVHTVGALEDLDWFAYSPGTVQGIPGVDMRHLTAVGATATNFSGDTVFTQAGYAFDAINADDFLPDEVTFTVQRFVVSYPPVADLDGVIAGADAIISWPSITNCSYKVSKTSDLLTAGDVTNDLWTVVASNLTATAPGNVYTNALSGGAVEFFKVNEEP